MVSEAYRELLSTGYARSSMTAGVGWSSSSARVTWIEECALPWWRALAERGRGEGLALRCFLVGDGYEFEYRAGAELLHPWLATSPLYWYRPEEQKRWTAVECWRRLAAEPWQRPPSARLAAELAGDYELLREHGSVVTRLFTPPALADPRFPPKPPGNREEFDRWRAARPRMGSPEASARQALQIEQHQLTADQKQQWRAEVVEPWFAHLVGRARADGLAAHSFQLGPLSNDWNESAHSSFGVVELLHSIYSTAPRELNLLLDRQGGESSEDARRRWSDEARARTSRSEDLSAVTP